MHRRKRVFLCMRHAYETPETRFIGSEAFDGAVARPKRGRNRSRVPAGFLLFAAVISVSSADAEHQDIPDPYQQASAYVADDGEPLSTGWELTIDNDLLVSPGIDNDYTGGIAFAMGGRKAASAAFSLDRLLSRIDRGVTLDNRLGRFHAYHQIQFGVIAFTPDNIMAERPQLTDRPFADLLFLENSRFYIDDENNRTYRTALTIGVLGSGFAAAAQRAIHRLSGSNQATGYDYQISDGGELTARYTVSRQSRLASISGGGGNTLDLKYAIEANIGYLTESSVTLAMRWGQVASPWWQFAPSRSNYLPQVMPKVGIDPLGKRRESYVWTAMTVRARVYNAFLQGQFQNSDVSLSSAELNHLIGEISAGFATSISRQWQLSYSLHLQTNEIKKGAGARNVSWGGLLISRRF